MKKARLVVIGMLALVVVLGGGVWAGEPERKAEVTGPYRVAVLPFETKGAAKDWPEDRGGEIADLLIGLLSQDPGLELVERAQLDKIQEEHALNLTGMAAPEETLKLGWLSGAQFMVFGRAFPLDRDICLVAKIVSVETGKMTAVIAQGPMEGELGGLVGELSGALRGAFQEKATALLPPLRDKEDAISRIKKAIAGKPIPRVFVTVEESHLGRPAGQIDPAVATELLFILKSCGFQVAEVQSADKVQEIKRWARRLRSALPGPAPVELPDADVIIVGTAITEFGARRGELVSCIGRLELQAVDADTGKVLAIARKTVRAVDLAETIAAKTALQTGTSAAAASFIPWSVAEWASSVEKEKAKMWRRGRR